MYIHENKIRWEEQCKMMEWMDRKVKGLPKKKCDVTPPVSLGIQTVSVSLTYYDQPTDRPTIGSFTVSPHK